MVKQTATPSPDGEAREDQLELPPSEASYDKELQEIQDSFFTIVSDLLTRDSSSAVQRTLLAVRDANFAQPLMLLCSSDVWGGGFFFVFTI